MSIVGTRPPTLDEWNKYELHHRARLAIKPGITGMWQVSGRSEITDFEEVVKLDTEYISEWNVEVMMYRLFQEGKNDLLMFAGSITMKGFRERSGGLMKKTGSAEPMVARTLRAEKKFLHLALCNGERKRQHVILFFLNPETMEREERIKCEETSAIRMVDEDMDIENVPGSEVRITEPRKATETQVVELLQILLYIVKKKMCIKFVISAWDRVEKKQEGNPIIPEEYLNPVYYLW